MSEQGVHLDYWGAIWWVVESEIKVMAGLEEETQTRRLRGREITVLPPGLEEETQTRRLRGKEITILPPGLEEETQTRRLRAREITVLPPAVRTSIANAGFNENARKAKASTKRAAADDTTFQTSNNAPAQHAKKRAVLANLAHNSNSVSHSSTSLLSKSDVHARNRKAHAPAGQVKAVKNAKQIPSQATEILQDASKEPNTGRSSLANSSITFENDENVCPERITSVNTKPQALGVLQPIGNESKTVASLERKTQHSLYISKESKVCARQGGLFEDYSNEQGWSCKTYVDIDTHKDAQMCSAYAAEIYHHLQMAEMKRRPATNFMELVQLDINSSMRGILVDWLVEVAEEYKLVPDTLYLTISYVDRYLSENLVSRQRLQLLGVACMLIASKYEEICAPQVEEFCYITDNTYNRGEVLNMERSVLSHLHFELAGPTTKSFLRRFVRAAQAGQKSSTLQLEFLGNYLSELTLLEYSFLQFLPSMIASAAVLVARVTLNRTSRPWNPTMQHYTGYKASELKECAKAVLELQKNTKNCTLPAIREKYRQHKFKCVASLVPPASIPAEYFHDIQ